MRAEIPVPLLPAHRRRVERRQQCCGRLGCRRRLEVAGEHIAGCAAEVDLGVRHDRERGAGVARRPAGPPAHVCLRGRAEGCEPALEQLRLRCGDVELLDRAAEPVLGRHPAELRADPGAARTASDEPTLHRQLRQHARAGALLDHPLPGAEAQLSRKERHVARHLGRHRSAARRHRRHGGVAGPRDPGAGPCRDAAVADEALEPLPLRRRDRSRRGGEHDRHEFARHGPERPAHREHSHERPLLVQDVLDVGRHDALAARLDREEDRDRVGGVQADERTRDRERVGCALGRREPMSADEPRASFLCPELVHAT